jgi:hypothetical protein
MNRKRKGTNNEHKTTAFLQKRGFIMMESRASLTPFDNMGLYAGEPEDMRWNSVAVQTKSNHHYDHNDIDGLRMIKKAFVEANNPVAVMLFDWHDGERYPLIIFIGLIPEEDEKLFI